MSLGRGQDNTQTAVFTKKEILRLLNHVVSQTMLFNEYDFTLNPHIENNTFVFGWGL